MTRFTVLLPVRNGWPYVKSCVESILAQTYPHFELHVLDNQSTDETVPWLESVQDERLRISSSARSLSIGESWGRLKEVEKEEFMTVIGHDDLFDPEFLEIGKALIDRHPDAGLYQVGARLINADGRKIRGCRPVPERETAADYLASRFAFERDMTGTGYIMRSGDYDRVGGIPPFESLFFADDALWLSLMKDSYKVSDSREGVSVRIHDESASASLPSVWPSLLLGLNQFTDFLQRFVKTDEEAKRVFDRLGGSFLLTYHRNAYIYALVEACQAGRRIDEETTARIASSLTASAPEVAGRLTDSAKVKLLMLLNATPLRGQVMRFWRLRNALKTRST